MKTLALLLGLAIITPVEASELPPIGQWVSCDDARYSIGGHGLCDFPIGPDGSDDSNFKLTDNATISLTSTNGTIINLKAFANGTVLVD